MSEKLIKMYRNVDVADGGPTEADVHPDEVKNYSAAGYSTEKPDGGKRSSKEDKE